MSTIPKAAMQNMTLSSPPTTKEAATKPPRSPQYKFPPMPADAKTCGRLYFFGFPVTFDSLAKVAEDYYGPPEEDDSDYSAWEGLIYLRAITGYRHLHIFGGVAQEGEKPQEDVCTPAVPGEKVTAIVGVFVNIRELAHRRPMQAQMDTLTDILGRPRWCMDALRMEDFDAYGIM
ncbi:hypothetical protein BD779DRAFT_1678046 [Infundibulicybe gibba]|nr:hypothetical protein BD779DRAFT_1678046 [Infundibulicybe gibba]